MEVHITQRFWRRFKKLPPLLRKEALQRIEEFQDSQRHPYLNIHKLHGKLKDRWSFSVNYRYRVVFMWEKKGESAILLAIGDHNVYDE